jgi:hypothetical protein
MAPLSLFPSKHSGRFHSSNNPFGYSQSFQFTEISLFSTGGNNFLAIISV